MNSLKQKPQKSSEARRLTKWGHAITLIVGIIMALATIFAAMLSRNESQIINTTIQNGPAPQPPRPQDTTSSKPVPKYMISISVNSTRALAKIFIDGEELGEAPGEIKVTQGRHELKLVYEDREYDGRWVYSETIFVSSDLKRNIDDNQFQREQ